MAGGSQVVVLIQKLATLLPLLGRVQQLPAQRSAAKCQVRLALGEDAAVYDAAISALPRFDALAALAVNKILQIGSHHPAALQKATASVQTDRDPDNTPSKVLYFVAELGLSIARWEAQMGNREAAEQAGPRHSSPSPRRFAGEDGSVLVSGRVVAHRG